jgi:hypothetical protein
MACGKYAPSVADHDLAEAGAAAALSSSVAFNTAFALVLDALPRRSS